MNNLRLVTLLALALTALIAVLQNTEVVAVRFLLWETQVSQVALTLLTLVIGFLLGVLGTLWLRRKR